MALVEPIRALLDAAFHHPDDGGFADEDWEHSLGGTHVLLELDGVLIAHAAVVPRTLWIGARPNVRAIQVGYVEAVATLPDQQGRGFGTAVMREVGAIIEREHTLGALSTGARDFYGRLGWEAWTGPTSVRHPDGRFERTPGDDDGILVLRAPASPPLDLAEPIACEWRSGDVW